MALAEDQRALIQLLLESGQSYDDIAAVLGTDAGEIRRRAAGALAAMGGGRAAADELLADFLLGQAAGDRAELARQGLAGAPELLAEARRLTALLKLIAPGGTVPALPREGESAPAPPSAETPKPRQPAGPAEPAERAAPAEPPTPPEPAMPAAPATKTDSGRTSMSAEPETPAEEAEAAPVDREAGPEEAPRARRAGPRGTAEGLDPGQKRLLAILLGTGFVVVAIVLGVSGVFSGADGGEEASPETAAQTEAAEEGLTQAVLQPTGEGGQGQGRAIFGSVEGTPVLQVTAQDLPPTPGDEQYNIWLYRNDQVLVRLGAVDVDQSGNLAAQFQLPAEALSLVARGQLNQIDISRSTAAAYQRELARGEQAQRLPRHVGASVLRGRITGPEIPAETE